MENKHDLMAAGDRGHTGGPVLAAVSYVPGEPPRTLQIDEIGKALLNPDALVWVGLHHPEESLLKDILRQLGMNEESLEILMGDIMMPRLSVFERELLIVLPTIIWKSDHSRPHFGRLACLVGERFLVTVRRGPSLPHYHLRERLEKSRSQLHLGCDHIAIEIIDDLIDRYVEAYKHFEVRVDRTERELMRATFNRGSISRLYIMRRDFHRFQVAIEPIGEICARVARLKAKPLSATARLRFDGLSDRITRLDRLFDSLGEGLAFAFEAGMLIEQSRQTDTTRKLAAWAAIISIPTAVAGVYGMNFENMPELKWEYGYYVVLGLMATVCTTLYVLFKRSKWL
ncbi:MAG: magnesium and cobalt transport protein CorA [Burkholderiaceae bacterium]|nr:magnesium and cobalt transport protein CorA [Burkholderiaceae bacterium]MCD8538093.1 magnesium and cobalt transport protein CorA [Burkholderiaceae bacterium]MCD8565699.1 magnesium and cobalt transport protein CorA [Burkholderiaceae bacterium]